jgi:hypothetical protein
MGTHAATPRQPPRQACLQRDYVVAQGIRKWLIQPEPYRGQQALLYAAAGG